MVEECRLTNRYQANKRLQRRDILGAVSVGGIELATRDGSKPRQDVYQDAEVDKADRLFQRARKRRSSEKRKSDQHQSLHDVITTSDVSKPAHTRPLNVSGARRVEMTVTTQRPSDPNHIRSRWCPRDAAPVASRRTSADDGSSERRFALRADVQQITSLITNFEERGKNVERQTQQQGDRTHPTAGRVDVHSKKARA